MDAIATRDKGNKIVSDLSIRNLKPKARLYRVACVTGGGLCLEIAPGGGKLWRLRYRFDGVAKMLALGAYPAVGLADARQRRDEAKKLLANGVDPGAVKQAQKRSQKIAAENSFEAVARQWHARWSSARSANHAKYTLTRMEADVFPVVGKKAVSALTASDFRDMVKKVEARGALDMAKRVLQVCGQVMRYAVAHDLAERNPVADIKPADIIRPYKKRNYARVNAKELPNLLLAIDGYAGSPHTRLALQFMALTFVRTNEMLGARWEEIDHDAKQWRIPAGRMKMDTEHIVPLSAQALKLLEKLREISYGRDLVFPGERKPDQPMSNNTILFALYRLGYRGRMTGHGFRGVASTILHEQGYPHEHIELQLAHAERNSVAAAYNHALYLPQRAKMMQAWADYLDKLKAGADVIPLLTAS